MQDRAICGREYDMITGNSALGAAIYFVIDGIKMDRPESLQYLIKELGFTPKEAIEYRAMLPKVDI